MLITFPFHIHNLYLALSSPAVTTIVVYATYTYMDLLKIMILLLANLSLTYYFPLAYFLHFEVTSYFSCLE